MGSEPTVPQRVSISSIRRLKNIQESKPQELRQPYRYMIDEAILLLEKAGKK